MVGDKGSSRLSVVLEIDGTHTVCSRVEMHLSQLTNYDVLYTVESSCLLSDSVKFRGLNTKYYVLQYAYDSNALLGTTAQPMLPLACHHTKLYKKRKKTFHHGKGKGSRFVGRHRSRRCR